jgi:hypothetical protein
MFSKYSWVQRSSFVQTGIKIGHFFCVANAEWFNYVQNYSIK